MTTPTPPPPAPETPGGDPWLTARLAAIYAIITRELAIYRAFRQAVDVFLAAARPRVLPGGRINPGGVFDVQRVWQRQIARVAREGVLPVLQDAFTRTWRTATGRAYTDTFDQLPFVQKYLREVENRLVRVPDELFDRIRADLEKGVLAGDDIPTIAAGIESRLLSGNAEVWRNRGTVVARTEVIGANNGGAFAAIKQSDSGDRMEKVWLATHDSRTRETHKLADGQRVPIAAPFVVGGFPGMHPGDPELPPQEVIQCRCTALYVRKGEVVA
jgi:uncharacterized protein with gpF-like domain